MKKIFFYYFIFEFFSYKIIDSLCNLNLDMKYNYLEWVYFFYYNYKNFYFYFYLYFIFTTSVFFTFLLWYRVRLISKDINDK